MQTTFEPIGLLHRPSWLRSRLRCLANWIGAGGIIAATAGRAWSRAPFAVEYTQFDLPLRRLPASFEGYRIVQVSDLHTGCGTPVPFLRRVMDEVNRLKPDLIVVTGDLVSHGMEYVEQAAELVGSLSPTPICIFGNHDYAPSIDTWTSTAVADALQSALASRGVTVLRNQAMSIDHPDGRLWIVGLEDIWSGLFNPAQAFADVPADEPAIVLSHNPDSIMEMRQYAPQWILAGHTHGGQIRIPVLGSVVLPVRHKQFDGGLFHVGPTSMYVTRGIGFRVRVRFRCPPEVPTFTLRAHNKT